MSQLPFCFEFSERVRQRCRRQSRRRGRRGRCRRGGRERPAAEEAAGAEAALRRRGRGTFTRPENLHLTLAFLGEAESAAPAQAALEAACTGGAVSLTVGGLGHFDDVWWAGQSGEIEKM